MEDSAAPSLIEWQLPDLVEPPAQVSMNYEIQPGDTLSDIFMEQGFGNTALNAVLAADEELLALDVLRPGTLLRFERATNSGDLLVLSIVSHPGHTIHYRRTINDHFEFEEEIKPSNWHEEVLGAPIHGSFYASASEAGLSDGDIFRAQRILEEKVNFRRDVRAGDHFEIVLGREMVDAGATGQTRIEAIRLRLGNRTLNAFLHEDGNYYDDHGESLSRAFLRYPMQGRYRVSSHFNLRRLHPVTGRIAPHHGVDFAMPTGTPILSIGDGIVSRVGNHPFAGKYIVIEHPSHFKTRYLHLSRIDVKQGQRLNRGDRIALSGNTGRSTGPHLHFELHVNNRPVDPLKADIPTASQVPAEEMAVFTQRVERLVAAMQANQTQLASRSTPQATKADI
ncbi:peptidoglycan DD-metalloendopeptidase family protein [Marinobacterium sp. BA1]|uniref:peptidoglycan DD-metalloendopeptidase family protein n=1 Tax=Marinobacterium sp. BA1 TaxID=3138931 RepID=UPI0034E89623